MNTTRQKISRLERLRAVEESQMSVLTAALNDIEHRLAKRRDQLAILTCELEGSAAAPDQPGVAGLNQATIWAKHLNNVAAELRRSIEAIENEREAVINQLIAQRSTVRGWETMIDRLGESLADKARNNELLLADDRYLSRRVK